MIARRPTRIDCDVGSLPADLAAVDALARLQLEGRRLGLDLHLRHASHELQELLCLAGLRDALRVEMSGHAEERKQRLGVEEERELDDPAV
jgi:hypothetical protein